MDRGLDWRPLMFSKVLCYKQRKKNMRTRAGRNLTTVGDGGGCGGRLGGWKHALSNQKVLSVGGGGARAPFFLTFVSTREPLDFRLGRPPITLAAAIAAATPALKR
jgi:hypothetical protein